MRQFAVFTWLVFYAVATGQPAGPIHASDGSQRIQQLKDQIAAGRAAAVSEFWTQGRTGPAHLWSSRFRGRSWPPPRHLRVARGS